jgi:hypothetical protein
MPDLTMCWDNECPFKRDCYRFTAKKSENQSWFLETPRKGKDCEYFWANYKIVKIDARKSPPHKVKQCRI